MGNPNDDLPPAYTPTAGGVSDTLPPANSSHHAADIDPPPPDYPPPPGFSHDYSSGANATASEADNAAHWCRAYPLTAPFPLAPHLLRIIHSHQHTLLTPPRFKGSVSLVNASTSSWRVESYRGCKDTLIQTTIPAYATLSDSPLVTERPRTIYFEIRILRLGASTSSTGPGHAHRLTSMFSRALHAADEECGVAIGFFAPPYPPFRLPGWQRGSVAIHSDDGRRYVSNPEGGVDCTTPFKVGETIGVGISFNMAAYIAGRAPKLEVDVVVTKDGRRIGGWNLERQGDAAVEKLEGLRGEMDLFPAIGVFGETEIEVNFGETTWLYRGW
jgi:hypothetical protein